jgi:hypothetical protein
LAPLTGGTASGSLPTPQSRDWRGNRCTACNGRGRVYANGPWSSESSERPEVS